MSAPRLKTILVTGFGAFPGVRVNPARTIMRMLGSSRRFALLGLRIEAHDLPVVYGRIEAELAALLARTRPDVVIHLGVAARRKAISVETRAINRIHMLRPDAARDFSASPVVVSGGAPFRKARWPAAQLVAAMRASGAPVKSSIDAGDYLCNQALYLTLGLSKAPAGFIHVPRVRGRAPVQDRVTAKPVRPTLAAMVRAVSAAIVVMSVRARNGASIRPAGSYPPPSRRT